MDGALKNLYIILINLLTLSSLLLAQEGNVAPDFNLDKLSGGKGTLSEHSGKVIYINWFGYSCPVCLGEGKSTQEDIVDNYSEDQFKAFGIDVWNGSSSQVQSFKNSTTIKYDLLLKGGSTASAYGVQYQNSIVIDKQGTIQFYGRTNKTSAINSKIQELLNVTALEDKITSPVKFELKNNYPNPFNPETRIPFSVDKTQNIKLEIYNISGKLVRTLIRASFAKGNFEATWNGTDDAGSGVASGVYFSRLQGESISKVRQLLLIK